MSERKVQNKYYPPDFDPSNVPRVKRKDNRKDVRIMSPCTMQCLTCNEYISPGKKFNAKKETLDEKYNGLLIFRFHIRCPRCSDPIIFRTDPKEIGYKVEQGARENFMALKRSEKEARQQTEVEEGEVDIIKQLEKKTLASRLQMEASEQISSIRSRRNEMNSIDIDTVIKTKREDSALSMRAEAERLLSRKTPHALSSSSETKTKAVPAEPTMHQSILSNLRKKIKIKPKGP